MLAKKKSVCLFGPTGREKERENKINVRLGYYLTFFKKANLPQKKNQHSFSIFFGTKKGSKKNNNRDTLSFSVTKSEQTRKT